MLPSISVIIPTFNGEHRIFNLLESIQKQAFTDLELIIVVDGSYDNTTYRLRHQELRFPMTIIEQANKGRAAARNAGAQVAKSELLLFLDDDMTVVEDTIGLHKQMHSSMESKILCGRQIESPDDSYSDFEIFKAQRSYFWESDIPKNVPIPIEKMYLTAAHFSILKSDFIKLGGFDERLTDAEDYDLGIRATMMQIPVIFCPELTSYHHNKLNCTKTINRQIQYQKAHQKLLSLHPEYQQINKYVKKVKRNIFKETVYVFLSLPLFPFFIDRINFFVLLPQKIRYKIYGSVVHAQVKYRTNDL
ncbi:MAG: glycosyltransferase [Bacteroidota bacterium]|nr:glycosyltransferase [Bacteroidota bacterium]